ATSRCRASCCKTPISSCPIALDGGPGIWFLNWLPSSNTHVRHAPARGSICEGAGQRFGKNGLGRKLGFTWYCSGSASSVCDRPAIAPITSVSSTSTIKGWSIGVFGTRRPGLRFIAYLLRVSITLIVGADLCVCPRIGFTGGAGAPHTGLPRYLFK